MRYFNSCIALIMSCLIFGSCLKGKDYDRSEFKKPFQEKTVWSGKEENSKPLSAAETVQPDWWKNFKDPYLNQLIESAIAGNIDLKIALARVSEAEITIRETNARRLPSASFSASENFNRMAVEIPDYSQYSEAIPKTGTEQNTTSLPNQDSIAKSHYINFGLSLTWESDLWGKKKHESLATMAAYQESQATYRGEYLRLVSETAQTYFDIRQKDRDIHISRKIYEDNKKRLSVYERQYSEGIIPQWKVSRQKAEVESSEKELSDIQSNRKILENKLALLLNKAPGNFNVPESDSEKYPEIIRVPSGLPSELMTRRPDVIAAAYRVLKAHNRLGESQAALLPSITLTGNASLASLALSNLLKQWTLGLTPSLSFPIFDGGAAKSRVESTGIQLKIAEDEYRKTVMKAFEEVENTLNNLESRTKQKAILEEKAKNMKQIYEQTIARFEMGLLSQIEVLDITRELYTTEMSLSSTCKMLGDDTVTLYKALGGGWSLPNIRIEELAIVEYQAKS